MTIVPVEERRFQTTSNETALFLHGKYYDPIYTLTPIAEVEVMITEGRWKAENEKQSCKLFISICNF